MALYITGSLNAVLGPEHQKEIIRYLYNHQVYLSPFTSCSYKNENNTNTGSNN